MGRLLRDTCCGCLGLTRRSSLFSPSLRGRFRSLQNLRLWQTVRALRSSIVISSLVHTCRLFLLTCCGRLGLARRRSPIFTRTGSILDHFRVYACGRLLRCHASPSSRAVSCTCAGCLCTHAAGVWGLPDVFLRFLYRSGSLSGHLRVDACGSLPRRRASPSITLEFTPVANCSGPSLFRQPRRSCVHVQESSSYMLRAFVAHPT